MILSTDEVLYSRKTYGTVWVDSHLNRPETACLYWWTGKGYNLKDRVPWKIRSQYFTSTAP